MYGEKTNTYRDEIARHVMELVKLARPNIAESDLEALANRTAGILERFALELRDSKGEGAAEFSRSRAYSVFETEMQGLSEWFREYQGRNRA